MVITYQMRKEILSMIRDALRDYFWPIKNTIVFMGKTLSLEEEKRSLEAKLSNNLTVLRVVQKAVCFNQGAYLQFAFITAEKHKLLKDVYRTAEPNPHDISLAAKELMDYVNKEFYESTRENFKILHAYFNNRKGKNPRICIKGNFRVDNKDTVVSVFRDNLVDYDSDTEIEKNYGFYSIYKNGTYFLENNIPEAAAIGSYFNPRIDNECAAYYCGEKTGREISDWKECWVDGSENRASFYKSTLIVPMTLWNNKVSDEFKRLINMENVERTIFGFLCFDHEDENYFDEDDDVAVGYIFSDILSLYVFTRIIYVEISKTFNSVESWLGDNGVNINPESLDSLWKSIPSNLNVDEMLEFKPKETSNNDLFEIDHDLWNFIKAKSANKQLNKDASR